MSKLKKFNKSNKKRNIIIVSTFLLTGIIFASISYAVYQKEDEVLFINARVGSFETSSSDIELAMTLDGEDVDVPPSKGYYNVTVECDNADGEWDKEKWGAVITNIKLNKVKCNVNFETLDVLASKVELGDYISMIPTATSYTIPTSLTGYSSNQTINPSELNLWRVIKKNEDGTVDVVSEYVSSKTIYFYGQTGYLNLVGSLNTIASQYTNSKYVSKTRHMGYSNQTLKCSDIYSCSMDSGYETDVNLVKTALGTLKSNNMNGSATYYWLASRGVVTNNGTTYYCSNVVSATNGAIGKWGLYFRISNGDYEAENYNEHIRPILTLKSDIDVVNGDGKCAETAYQLN